MFWRVSKVNNPVNFYENIIRNLTVLINFPNKSLNIYTKFFSKAQAYIPLIKFQISRNLMDSIIIGNCTLKKRGIFIFF